MGYNVFVLDFKNPDRSDHFNFLQEVIDAINDDNIPLAQKKALDITEALVGNDTSNEKIWSEGEKSIMAACILAVVKRYIDTIEALNPNHPALALISATRVAPSKTQGSFNISALATLRLFADINVYNLTKSNSFKIEDLNDQKTAIFIILPDYNTTYYGVASLFE